MGTAYGRLCVAVAAGFLITCSTLNPLSDENNTSDSGGDSAPSPSLNGDSLSVIALEEHGLANGKDQLTVMAAVFDSAGRPKQGALALFSAPQQLRRLNDDSLSGEAGSVNAIFVCDQPGSYGVAAKIVSNGDTLADSVVLSFSDINSTVSFSSIAVTPDSIYLNDAAEIKVSVINRAGTAPAGGQTVRFTLTDPRLGSIEDSVTTDSNGTAIATFVSGLISGKTSITIEAGGMYRSAPITVRGGEGKPSDIMVDASPWKISVRGTGGISKSELRFTVVDKRGNPISERYRAKLRVSAIQGPGGGLFFSDTIVYTDKAGQAISVLNAGTKSGNVIIKCELLDSSLASAVTIERSIVTITGGPPDKNHFHIVKEHHNIWAWDYVGNTTTITAYVGDRYGNPVPAGYVVNFFTTGGLIEGAAITDEKGAAAVELVGQGSDKIDIRAQPDSTDFAPLRDDIDPRHFLRPADQSFQNFPRSIERYILRDTAVHIAPINIRGENRQTGDGQAIVFASVSNDSSHYGCDTCSSNLLWDWTRVVFSARPNDSTVHEVRINGEQTSAAVINNNGHADITCYIADINGNPLVGGAKFTIDTDIEGVKVGKYIKEMPDAEAGYQFFHVRISDDNMSSTQYLPATVRSQTGGSYDGLAARPARIIGHTDIRHFDLAGSRAEVWSGEVAYGPGIDGMELKIAVDGKPATVAFSALDTSISAVVGRLSRELDSICGLQQQAGKLRLFSLGYGDTSRISVYPSSGANYLGMIPGTYRGSQPDTLFLEANGVMYTVTFAPGDSTLARVAQRISSSAPPALAAATRDEGGRGTLEIRTMEAGSEASLRVLPNSTLLDELGILSGIGGYAYGQSGTKLLVQVDALPVDTVVFRQKDTTAIEIMQSIRALGSVNVESQDGEILIKSKTVGSESSIQVMAEGSSANGVFNFPTTKKFGSEFVDGEAGMVYLSIDHPGMLEISYPLAYLVFR